MIFGICMISFPIVNVKEQGGKGEIVYETVRNDRKFTEMCEKPTPLGVGWIAQKNKTMCM